MKTKLLAIASACAGTLAASAQTNCITIPDGEFRLVRCPYVLQGGHQWIVAVFPPPPSATLHVLTWNGFSLDENAFSQGGWDSEPMGCFPGSAVVLYSVGGPITVCFPEPVQSPALPLSLACGFNLVSCQSNLVAGFQDIVGRAPWEGVQVYKLNPGPGRNVGHFAPPDYTVYTFSAGSWSPAVPTAEAVEAVFVYQPPPKLWNLQAGNGAVRFDVTAPPDRTVVVEYADDYSSPDSAAWKEFSRFVGSGNFQAATHEVGQISRRFYRARLLY